MIQSKTSTCSVVNLTFMSSKYEPAILSCDNDQRIFVLTGVN